MRNYMFLFGLLALLVFGSFQVEDPIVYSLDKAHSRLGFKIKHMGIVDIHGEFNKFDVIITLNNGSWDGSSFEMSAEANSIYTGIEMRDDHLRSADFFDVENHPHLTFKSSSVKKVKNKLIIIGDFTLHGITKSLRLIGEPTGTTKKNDIEAFGLRITGVVKRSDFKIGEPSGGLSDDVQLIADLELTSK
ncbi:MAG: YceI family protein [Bacteroidetes bacterium]|nr:YceI family protein [Bacteroidota bacterium]